MPLIKPMQQDDELLNDILFFESDISFRTWWLGQSGFLIKWKKKYLLLDPYLSDSLTEKYRQTDKPHTRMSERVVIPAALRFVNVVTSSHNHTDHLDADTLVPILSGNPSVTFIIPEANRSFVVSRVALDPTFPKGLTEGTSHMAHGFTITGIASAHNELERDNNGNCIYLGYIIQFGGYTVYHSGDTLWYNGLEKTLQSYHVDLAFLPINGNRPERKVAGNLNAGEAALLAKAIGAKLTIPHHYHMFEFNTEDPQAFADHCLKHDVKYKVLELGEGICINR